MRREELHDTGPRVLSRLQVRATGACLRTHESVPRSLIRVNLVALPELFHRGFGWGNRCADARVVTRVEPEDRSFQVRQLRLDRAIPRAGRIAVVDDGRVQRGLRSRKAEAARSAPTEPDHTGLAVRGRQLLAVLHRRIEAGVDLIGRQ